MQNKYISLSKVGVERGGLPSRQQETGGIDHYSRFLFQELKEQTQECHAQNKDLASQVVSGIRTVRSFSAEKDELRRYSVALNELHAIKRRSGIYSAVYLLIRRVRHVVFSVTCLEMSAVWGSPLLFCPDGVSGYKDGHVDSGSQSYHLRAAQHRESRVLLLVPKAHVSQFKSKRSRMFHIFRCHLYEMCFIDVEFFTAGDYVLLRRDGVNGWSHFQSAELSRPDTKVWEGGRLGSWEAGGQNHFPKCHLELSVVFFRQTSSEGKTQLEFGVFGTVLKATSMILLRCFLLSPSHWSCRRGGSQLWWVPQVVESLPASASWRGFMSLRRVRSCWMGRRCTTTNKNTSIRR